MGLFDGLKSLWAKMHVSSHVGHVSTTSSAMSAPHHWPCHPLCPCQCPSMTFILDIKNKLGLGFRGPGTFYDGFKMSWNKQSVTNF